VLLWLENQDPSRKAARLAKQSATQRKVFLRRQKKQAAGLMPETTPEKWYTINELTQMTGWDRAHLRVMTAQWPRRASQRPDKGSNRAVELYGCPRALINKRLPLAARHAPPMHAVQPAALAPLPARKLTIWQRIKRLFF
jgi:hypothetical protein